MRGRDPVAWRERFRQRREEAIAHLKAGKDFSAKARHANTRPAHEIAAYAGDYEHPAYGLMSIREQDGALQWSWRGLFAELIHRHYETFELPEVPDRHVPDKLDITFQTDREGSIVSLSAPLDPTVEDIVFLHRATERVKGTFVFRTPNSAGTKQECSAAQGIRQESRVQQTAT